MGGGARGRGSLLEEGCLVGGGAASWRKGVWRGEGQPLGGRVSGGGRGSLLEEGRLVGGGAASWRVSGGGRGSLLEEGCLVGGGAASWRKDVWWGEGQPLGGRMSDGGGCLGEG